MNWIVPLSSCCAINDFESKGMRAKVNGGGSCGGVVHCYLVFQILCNFMWTVEVLTSHVHGGCLAPECFHAVFRDYVEGYERLFANLLVQHTLAKDYYTCFYG